MRLTQAGQWDEAALAFISGASVGLDSYDAENPSGSYVDVATVPQPGLSLAINVMDALTGTQEVPLRISMPLVGTAQLSFTGINTFAPGTQLYLRDNLTGTITDLSTTSSYVFTTTTDPASAATGRLVLIATNGNVTSVKPTQASLLEVYPNPASTLNHVTVSLAGFGTGKAHVEFIDVTGKVVLTRSLLLNNGLGGEEIELTNLANGTYTIRATSSYKVLTQRFIRE